jgi:hypothetical protein
VAASGPHTRRRPSRTTSGTKGSPLSASPPYPYSEEQDEDDRKTKPPRNTLKKLLRRDSHHADTVPAPRGGQEELEEEESNVGYIPRLGQIREKKTTMQSRRRGSSIVSSTGQPKALRRRHTEDSAAGRSRVRRKPSSLHRHGGKLAELSEPSSASSVSQQSGTSSGSNSTVTQQAREDHGYTYQYQIPGERHSPASSMMNVGDSEVFKYLQPDYDTENSTPAYPQAIAPSIDASPFSSSPPLGDSSLGDKRSSVVTDSQDANGSKATSPSLAQQSNPTESQLPHQEFRKFKKPLYASSFVHGPRDEDEETVNQSGESEGSCTESAEESEHSNEFNKATTKAPPPRAPSTSSRGSDPHARRLKQQERELANHILKNPKPQKGFQFNAGTPAPVYPPMPMYSPQVYSATSPSAVSPAVNSPQGWPPMHSFPAPLAIGYAPHQSPEAVHAYPHSVVKQMPPPFSPHPMQPPHYQQQAPSSNQTKPSLTGYELLANELSAPSQSDTAREKNIVPMYRKFEHLNHRVLLHLQDEMCELEEELRQLDRCIAQMSPKDPSGYAYPASRRNDARYGGDLHFKRTELLGRIFQKLEQYSKYGAFTSTPDRRRYFCKQFMLMQPRQGPVVV